MVLARTHYHNWRYASRAAVTATLACLATVPPHGCDRPSETQRGRTVDKPAVTRVIALAPNAAEIICMLGAAEALVGVSSFCTWPPELANVPRIGGLRDPDLEVVMSLKPDLVVLRGQHGPLRGLCRDQHIPIFDDQVETLDELYATVTELGRLLGRRAQADEANRDIRVSLQRVADRAAGRPRPRVLFVVLRSPGVVADVMTTGGKTFLHELIEIAGGVNIFGDQDVLYPKVSLEEIVARSPDVIIETRPTDTIDDVRRGALLDEWGTLPTLPAVRSGRVHFLTEHYITIPSARVTKTARAFLSLIHPGLDGGG